MLQTQGFRTTAPSSPKNARIGRRPCNIDQVQETFEAVGWNVGFRQLQPGRLRAAVVTADCGGISIVGACSSHRLNVAGRLPDGHITVIVPATTLWVNGEKLDHNDLLIAQAGAEIRSIVDERANLLVMHIPTGKLDSGTGFTAEMPRLFERGEQVTKIRPAPASLRHLRQLMRSPLVREVSASAARQQAFALITALCDIVEHRPIRSEVESAKPRKMLLRAIRLVDTRTRIGDEVSVSDLCEHSAMSMSKLERTFRRELAMSPSQYIQFRRLAEVNQELKNADPESARVAQIAMDYGFNHLGRFAGIYREQFGELPSETLHAGSPDVASPLAIAS